MYSKPLETSTIDTYYYQEKFLDVIVQTNYEMTNVSMKHSGKIDRIYNIKTTEICT